MNAGKSSSGGTRKSTGLLPQMICTISSIANARPKVNSSSATWPFLCTRRSPKRSTPAPIAPASSGAITSAGQKPNQRLIWKSEESAEHVEARMREVEHAEHAEDDGEPARHQKQQHAEQHAVERGDDDQFKHGHSPCGSRHLAPHAGEVGSRSHPGEAPTAIRDGELTRSPNGQFGRSILQVVGSMVCAVSTLATSLPAPAGLLLVERLLVVAARRTRRCRSAGRTDGRPCAWCPCRRRARRSPCLRAPVATLTGSIDLALSAAAANIRISLTARG